MKLSSVSHTSLPVAFQLQLLCEILASSGCLQALLPCTLQWSEHDLLDKDGCSSNILSGIRGSAGDCVVLRVILCLLLLILAL